MASAVLEVELLVFEADPNTLQYSCLENPMDGEAWWARVHGVAKNQTRLKQLSTAQHCEVGRHLFGDKISSDVPHITQNTHVLHHPSRKRNEKELQFTQFFFFFAFHQFYWSYIQNSLYKSFKITSYYKNSLQFSSDCTNT